VGWCQAVFGSVEFLMDSDGGPVSAGPAGCRREAIKFADQGDCPMRFVWGICFMAGPTVAGLCGLLSGVRGWKAGRWCWM